MSVPESSEIVAAALEPFLETRLTALGLDYETYGPYLLPVLTSAPEEQEEEWESVLELLRASSETHSDDEQVWIALRKDVGEAWRLHQAERDAQLKEQHEKDMRAYNEELLKEREAARQAELDRQEEQQKIAAAANASSVDDDAKRALVERYAYENDGGDDQGGIEEERPMSNKEAAALAAQEQAREMRTQKKTTKREEQQKTAQAKLEKTRLKEERRKKTTKGERKR